MLLAVLFPLHRLPCGPEGGNTGETSLKSASGMEPLRGRLPSPQVEGKVDADALGAVPMLEGLLLDPSTGALLRRCTGTYLPAGDTGIGPGEDLWAARAAAASLLALPVRSRLRLLEGSTGSHSSDSETCEAAEAAAISAATSARKWAGRLSNEAEGWGSSTRGTLIW